MCENRLCSELAANHAQVNLRFNAADCLLVPDFCSSILELKERLLVVCAAYNYMVLIVK